MRKIQPLVGEKCEKESDNAVLACNDWLRLGPGRTIPKLLDSYDQKSTTINNFNAPSKSYTTLRAWSSKYNWQERAAEFDAGYEERVNQEREAALSYGLALDYERIGELKKLYALLNDQLYERDESGNLINLWVADVKQIGSGKDAEQVDIERFNSSLITQIRGVLDDLAKEAGGRMQKTSNEHTGKIETEVTLDFSGLSTEQLIALAKSLKSDV